MNSHSLSLLSSEVLDARLRAMVTAERKSLVDFLWHLAEVERRRLDTELGYDSAFTYCHEHLGLPRATSYRRSTTARLLATYPVIADYLTDGRLGLGTVLELRDVLEPSNHRQLLDAASGKSKDDVKLLVATMRPRPDVGDSIRRVIPKALELPAFSSRLEPATMAPASEPVAPLVAPMTVTVVRPPPPPSVEPLNAERYAIRFSASREFMEDLDEVKAALSHVVPSGNLEDVLRECMRLALDACQRRRAGSPTARAEHVATQVEPVPVDNCSTLELESSGAVEASSSTVELTEAAESGSSLEPRRYIPVEVRRRVFERDGGRCTFVGSTGRRCNSRFQLEFHHRRAFALGGESTVENLTLACGPHNRHQAYLDFGEEHMSRFIAGNAEAT